MEKEVKVEEKKLTIGEFILKASKCIHNHSWTCEHEDNVGNKCKKICENYYSHK